jgi:hypothetical protein
VRRARMRRSRPGTSGLRVRCGASCTP